MIPRSRLWKVSLRDATDTLIGSVVVYAPNRRFARWNGIDRLRESIDSQVCARALVRGRVSVSTYTTKEVRS